MICCNKLENKILFQELFDDTTWGLLYFSRFCIINLPLDTIHCFFRLSLFTFQLLQCYTKAEGSATLAYDDEKQILLYFDSIGGVCMIDVVSTIHDVLLTSPYITYQMIIHIKHINTRPKFAVQCNDLKRQEKQYIVASWDIDAVT